MIQQPVFHGTLSISHGRNHFTFISRDFLKYKFALYLKQPSNTQPQHKIFVVFRTLPRMHRLVIEINCWTISPNPLDILCQLCLYNVVDQRGAFHVGLPPIEPH